MTESRTNRADLNVATALAEFADEALADADLDPERFWRGLSSLLRDLTPRNHELLARRDELQSLLDDYHRARPGQPSHVEYQQFLESIGYLTSQPSDFFISPTGVDEAISTMAGPQLVVPLLNARFAINAANARWGSLYDALYGTDAVDEDEGRARSGSYNPIRGGAVIDFGRRMLDSHTPLVHGSHAEARAYRVTAGSLEIELADRSRTALADPTAFVGFTGPEDAPTAILLRHHGLHIHLSIDPTGSIGSSDLAGVNDIVLEAAVTTIMDLEDSVAAVDAADKALGYRNWRGLMRGTLTASFASGSRTVERVMNADREYTGADGKRLVLPGRSLLLIRNVGHHMRTDAVKTADGEDVFEGILDAVMTTLGALSDLRGVSSLRNSAAGSMYIVKPKMHGPEEVAFAVEILRRTEQLLDLEPRTLKIGIMDEERRTSLNLRASIKEAADRVVFINTGFLDRTGGEIHASLHAGAMAPKAGLRTARFLEAYETSNVDAGIATGFPGRAQIGKGMWAMPDLMHDMLIQKVAHPRSGATTAWVPSPTAAVLHALHYHEVDVIAVEQQLRSRRPTDRSQMLILPLQPTPLDRATVLRALDESAQSILGYVSRWIDQGVGCSKVLDINGVALMEDRATLRISSQLLANWLEVGLIDLADVDDSLRRQAAVVDAQNALDSDYEQLVGQRGPGIAFQAARRLILEGARQPDGYTEPILHEMRRRKKAESA